MNKIGNPEIDDAFIDDDSTSPVEHAINPKAGMAQRLIEFSKTTAPHCVGEDKTRDLFEDLCDEDRLPQ